MLLDRQTDPTSLAAYGAEATRLLCSGRIDALAGQFGYALAYHREPAAAIREDLSRCLAKINASSLVPGTEVPTVKYFEPNDAKLFALVECVAVADNGRRVLVELVVAGDDSVKHMSLEDISAA
jgi:hypothetical protein